VPWTDPANQTGPDHPDWTLHRERQRRPGYPYWSSLLGEWIDEPTQPLPVIGPPPEAAPAVESREGSR
jgi:hypothetical protein